MLAFIGGIILGLFLGFVLVKNSGQEAHAQRRYYGEDEKNEDEDDEDDDEEEDYPLSAQTRQVPFNRHGVIALKDAEEIKDWLEDNPDLRRANRL